MSSTSNKNGKTGIRYEFYIISTSLEHPSVSGPLTYLQEQGFEIDLVEIDRTPSSNPAVDDLI